MKETHRGSSGATSSAAASAAFALSVSKIVSNINRSTPPSRSAVIWSAYVSWTWSNVTGRKPASSTFGDTESETFSGPSDPATKPPTSSAACRASRAPSRLYLGGDGLEPVVGLADPGGEGVGGRDVRARGEVAPVDVEDHLGPREVEKVGIAGDVVRVVAEPFGPVRLLTAYVPLNQHAPRPVQQDDPLVEQSLQVFDPVGHLAPSAERAARPGATGSLGVW